MYIDTSRNPFQIIFNPVQNIKTGTYYRTIHPQIIPITTQYTFVTYLNKLIKYNENLEHTIYRPSHLERVQEKSDYFEVKDIEAKIKTPKQSLLLVTTRYITINSITIQIFSE